jgi:hypothetical protein
VKIIYQKQENREPADCMPQPQRRARMPELVNWKKENRRRQKETRDWIKKRGYWKPDIPASPAQPGKVSRKLKPPVTGSCSAILFRHTEDKKFNRDIEYWKGYLRNTACGGR